MDAIRHAVGRMMRLESLSSDEAEAAMGDIFTGSATQAQIGAFLASLRTKGETADEILGCARAMRASATAVTPVRHGCVDTCGTGGDMAGTFNISTISAFVVAGAGVPVAKHGNRSISSTCGSADVLEALGVNLSLTAEQVARCVDQVGIGFMFAPMLHPAMAHAMGPRRELGVRTVFNLLGPLANPAQVPFQVVGVFDRSLTEIIATVMAGLGVSRALVVHGDDGLDELTTAGGSVISEMHNGEVRTYRLYPEGLGLPRASRSDLLGGDPATNAGIARSVLSGERGPQRDIVVLNAAAALYVAGQADSIGEALPLATQSIDTGHAAERLEALISLSRTLTEAAP
ncbi:MAG: anthranilate phosphoribosyltransferase [Anaerolineae bacterium]|nr:anthranilate phosphoribosyltransferase [Anaerolineae bacterium]